MGRRTFIFSKQELRAKFFILNLLLILASCSKNAAPERRIPEQNSNSSSAVSDKQNYELEQSQIKKEFIGIFCLNF